MYILYLIDTLNVGGAERSILEIVSKFKKYKPIVISIYSGSQLVEEYSDRDIRFIMLNIPEKYNFQLAVHKIKPILEQFSPVLIHTTLFRSDIIGRRLKKYFTIPLINSLVNNTYSALRYNNLSFFSKTKLFLIQGYDMWTSRRVDLYISNSEAIKLSNSKDLLLNRKKVRVIPRGRNYKHLTNVNLVAASKLHQSLGLAGKRVFLNVSRLLYRKGQLDLIRAFSGVIDEFSNAILLIAGEGPFRKELEAAILKYRLQHNVFLLGNRDDIPELLSIADFFLFSSYYEGLPGALIEAMMAGKVIICSDIPENRECVNENTALFFKRGDIAGIDKLILEVLRHPDSYLSLGIKASEFALKKFEVSAIAGQYEAIYDQVLAEYHENTSAHSERTI